MKVTQLLVILYIWGWLSELAYSQEGLRSPDDPQLVVWLYPDVPPFNINGGQNSGQGSIDQIVRFISSHLPEYRYTRDVASFARAATELKNKSNICTAAVLKYEDREAFIEYSIPYMVVLPTQLVTRKNDRYKVLPYIDDQGRVDMTDLMLSGLFKLGVAKGRRYGNANIDEAIFNPPRPGSIYVRHGTDQFAGLLRMLITDDRAIHGIIGYPAEIAYFGRQMDVDLSSLASFPIKGDPEYNAVHIGCSKSPLGREIIGKINNIILRYRQTRILEMSIQWLSEELAKEHGRLTHKAFTETP